MATAYLPYTKDFRDKIGRLLKKKRIKTIYNTTVKISLAFPKFKNPEEELQGPGVYNIPWTYGEINIGQTGRHVRTILKEYKSHLKKQQHGTVGYSPTQSRFRAPIKFDKTNILMKEQRF